MKNIAMFFIQRPMFVNFVLVLNFIFGAYFLYKIPKETFPGVSMNQIVVVTKYPGASAKDVELNVTAKIEEILAEVGNIREYRSNSIESVSRITIFADDDLNDMQFKDLLADVETEVDKIDDLPSDVEGRPIVTSVTTEDRPIMQIAFTGSYDLLKNVVPSLEKDLRKISGISSVNTVGIPDEEIHIEVDAKKAIDKEIDLNSIYAAINTRNQVGTGGTLESFIAQKKIVSFNKYEHAQDVLNTIIRMSPDGHGVYLKDVASITYQPKANKLIVRNNGKRGGSIILAIRSGIDQLKISDKIKKLLDKVILPDGVSVTINRDVSDKARSKFDLLKTNGIIGFLFVLVLLFYFLGSKTAFWTAFGIPFSIFGSMLFFAPLGMTFNSVSMGAFVIVLGMIVDDAMVISERFNTNIKNGQSREEAAANSVDRLWRPVFAASLTTITAFLPLLALGGLPGKFIWQMPAVVMIALFVSLIDCYFLLPAHLAHGKPKKNDTQKNKIVILWENLYEKVLTKLLNFHYLVLLFFTVIFIGSVFIGATKLKKDSFPQEATEGFTMTTTLQKGIAPSEVEKIISKVEVAIDTLPKNELRGYTARIGTHSISSGTDYGTEENLVAFMVYLTPYADRDRTAQNIIDYIKSEVGQSFKSSGYPLEFELTRLGPPLGKPFEIIVSSNDDKIRKKASDGVISYLKTVDGLFDIKDDNIPGKDEINLKLDYQKVAQAGLTPADIIRTLRIAFDGQVVTDYTSVNKTYDFRLRLNKETRGDLNFISKLPIANKRGQLIKLSSMISYEENPSYAEVKRFNGTRATAVTGNINKKKVTAIEMLKVFKNKFKNTDTVKYLLSGQPVEEGKIFSGLMIAAVMAIVGIYLILSLIFNSYVKPFLVLAVIPFGIVGIFLSFFLHGLPMSMFAGIGLIGLSGIVINDSIVLIDHLNHMIKENGVFTQEILIQAAKERLRPISLTTISTVLAIAPTAYGLGGYDPLLSPLSLAILYGLLFGTTVVLIFIPALYISGVKVGKILNKKNNITIASLITIIAISSTTIFSTQTIAQDKIGISAIVNILNGSHEYKIQDENTLQGSYQRDAVEVMLDPRLTTKLVKLSSVNYPNPPVAVDSKKDSYGISVDYSKMTSLGFKYELGIGFDKKEMGTIPVNAQYSLDASDSTYRAALAVPLYRNFGSREYHIRKSTSVLQSDVIKLQSKDEKDKILVDAITSFWNISKAVTEEQIATHSLKRFNQIHLLNKIKKRSGIISESELLTSEVELINRKKILTDTSAQLNIEVLKLNRILELKNRISLSQIQTDINQGKMFKMLSAHEVKSIIDSGSTTTLVKKNEELMKNLLKLEKERNKSNVDLFVSWKSYGRGTDLSSSFSENTQDKYEAMAGLTWNFDFGNHQSTSEINRILSKKRQATMRKSQLKQKLHDLYNETHERIKSNLVSIKSLNEIKRRQERILKIENKRFRNGKITTLDFVKLQEAFDKSNLQVTNLKYANQLFALSLYKALGRIDLYLN